MKLGVFVLLQKNMDEEFAKLAANGFSTCQLGCWDMSLYNDESAESVNKAAEKYGITVTALWAGWSGPAMWNFIDGPATLGIVPSAYRFQRIGELMQGSDFAEKINVTDIITHMGFLPENPSTTEYMEVLAAIKKIASYCQKKGQYLLFETGQETPVTLRRTIEDVGTGNLGINLDPANLILYGKANPVDALTVFGEYVRNIHGKDGKYPTNGRELGVETPIGQGHVNYPAFIKKLKEIGYDGPITIEREISGDEQTRDILMAKELIEKLWNE